MTTIELLLSEAKKYNLSGWLPIGAEQPPKGYTWTDKRGTSASKEYLEEYFNNNHNELIIFQKLETKRVTGQRHQHST